PNQPSGEWAPGTVHSATNHSSGSWLFRPPRSDSWPIFVRGCSRHFLGPHPAQICFTLWERFVRRLKRSCRGARL
ncbi:hypothetical protein V5799_026588, partial [Amblyomma americanum]